MFFNNNKFSGTGGLSNWDVSKVDYAIDMFRNAHKFNGDVSGWRFKEYHDHDMNFQRMFMGAVAFNSDVSDWVLSAFEDMTEMFKGAISFNSDLTDWDVSNVIRCGEMFAGTTSFVRTFCSKEWIDSPISLVDFRPMIVSNPGFNNKPQAGGGAMVCCDPGAYFLNTKDGNGIWQCSPCGKGTYNDDFNLLQTCSKCPRDTIAPSAGLKNCGACGSGTYSNIERTACDVCGAGFHEVRPSGADKETTCSPCPVGKFQDQSGSSSCFNCPTGWYQGSTSKPFCLPCVPGTSSIVLFFFCSFFLFFSPLLRDVARS
jgi:surface protein